MTTWACFAVSSPTIPPENMQLQYSYDNNGPYLKIYFNENNMNMTNEYELFDRNPHDLPVYNRDGLNNYLPNTQNQLPSMPSKNPTIQSSVIHHLVSSLGPNKTGSYSPFGETIINNSMPAPQCNVEPVLPDMASCSPPPNQLNVAPPMNVKKTRIVAEVKPMRMSYSDVVSKNVLNEQASAMSPTTGSTNSASSSPNTTLPVTAKSVKVDKSKYGFDKKSSEGDKENQVKAKKSPINTSVNSNGSVSADHRKPQANVGKTQSSTSSVKKRTSQGSGKDSSANGIKVLLNQSGCSRGAKVKYASDSEGEDDENSSILESDDDEIDLEFYNVHQNVCHGEHHNIEKINTTKGSTSYKKVKNTSAGSTKKAEKVQRRSVKVSSSRKRQKHEVLLKLCIAWGEYVLKIIQWLWTLIYDVGYLSCGIIWDRLSWCFQYAAQGFETVRGELNGSPGKAAWLWIINTWKKFDGRFDKKSRWAFWRWMFKKKPPASETVKDYYKDGKLPKTAEEAMKSLLNCKGKDAYRWVSVSLFEILRINYFFVAFSV